MNPNPTRRSLLRTTGALSALGTFGVGSASAGFPADVIVGTDSPAAERAARSRADHVRRELDFGTRGRAIAGRFPPEAREALANRPDVRYVEPDAVVDLLAESLPWGIDRIDAERAHDTATGAGADVAIIDSGIDADHPDLAGNLGTGYAVVTCSDCSEPWDDDHGHGTHCAGIAAAVDNTEGVVGVSAAATLHAVKVFSADEYATVSGLAAGIQWVADRGYDVGSLSLGTTSDYTTLREACQYAADRDVFLVAAAGNDGPCEDCVRYPAAYTTVVAVSATDSDDSLSSFSSAGPEVDLAAPGSSIESTLPGGYGSMSGTSMACPHVAGAAGLLMADGYTSAEARDRLASSAEDIGLTSDAQGAGLVDAEAAVAAANEPALAVSTGDATDVGETTVTLSGSLDDLGGATEADVAFEYRESGASTWTATAAQTLTAAGSVSASVTGLSAGTGYEYRCVAVASDGDTAIGGTSSFTTQSADTNVVVSTGEATDVGETAATLTGSLDDLGGAAEADVAFEWGVAGEGLPETTASQTRSSVGEFTTVVDGLTAGTDYEFRAVVTASDGDTDTGTARAFTTTTGGDSGSASPTVDEYVVTEAGSPNPHAEITAEWTVRDADGDLDSVRLRVLSATGSVLATERTAVSGATATSRDDVTVKHAGSATFEVRLQVTDAAGNTTVASTTVQS